MHYSVLQYVEYACKPWFPGNENDERSVSLNWASTLTVIKQTANVNLFRIISKDVLKHSFTVEEKLLILFKLQYNFSYKSVLSGSKPDL